MPAAGRTVRVEFPLAGVDRSVGFQRQPPFTTRDAVNVRAREQQGGTRMGATRAGLIEADPTDLGAAVRLLNAVNVVPDSTTLTHRNEFRDTFTDPPLESAPRYRGHYFWYGNFFHNRPGFVANAPSTPFPALAVPLGTTETSGLWLETSQPPILTTDGASMQFAVATLPFFQSGMTEWGYGDTIRMYLTTQAVLDAVAAAGANTFFNRNLGLLPERDVRFSGFVITLVRSEHPFLSGVVEDPYDVLIQPGNLPRHDKRLSTGAYELRVDEVLPGQTRRLMTLGGDDSHVFPEELEATLSYSASGTMLRVEYIRSGVIFGDTDPVAVDDTLGRSIARLGFSQSNNLSVNVGFPYLSLVTHARVAWSSAATTFEKPENILIAGANGRINVRDASLVMADSDVESPVDIATDHDVPSAAWLQRLYVSDYGRVTEGNCGVASNVIQSGGVPVDFAAFDIDANDHTLVLYDTPEPETQSGSYSFTLATGQGDDADETHMTLTDYPRGSPTTVDIADGLAKYRVERAPKIFDPTRAGVTAGVTDSDTIQATSKLHKWVATAGLVPAGCPILVGWLGRAVLAGPSYAPHAWWMSRSGVWTDFDHGQPAADVGAAIADSTFDRGSIGRPITAVVPHTEDYLLFASNEDMHAFVGDPGRNGYMQFLSPVGIVAHDAWAHDPQGRLLFLSREGLFVQPAGLQGRPEMFSKRRMPRELLEVDSAQSEVSVAYDARDSVFHVFLKPHASTTAKMWTVELETAAIWPGRLGDADFQPTTAFDYRAFAASDSDLILGCLDGFLRRFGRGGASGLDGPVEFEQYVWIGPLNLSPDGDREGMITELSAVLSQGSSPVTWTLHVGDSPESAFGAGAFDAGTFTPGQNLRFRPRAKALAAFVRLSATGAAWAIEHLTLRVRLAGRRRP